MKKLVSEFFRRGLVACGFGPLVLAVLYLLLQHTAAVRVLTVDQVCIGIVSLSALAFIAGGINVVYRMEQLPLMAAISIHGGVLYISYLATYLLNGWLAWGIAPILVFTTIFLLGYVAIWAVIYTITRRTTARLNRALKQKQQDTAEDPTAL